MSAAKRRRPLKVAADRPGAEVLAALRDPRLLGRAALPDLVAVLMAARGRAVSEGMRKRPRPGGEFETDLLVELAAGRAVVERIAADRWRVVSHALDFGVPLVEVAGVLDLEVSEVQAGLVSWGRREVEAGRLDEAGLDALLELLDSGDGAR